MLHTGHEVVSLDLGDLTALGVDPLRTLTQMEGVGQAVLGLFPALSQSGLHDVLGVILHQAVEGVDQGLSIRSLRGCQNVPSLGVGGIAHGVSILQGVAVLGQPLLALGFPSAGALELSPHGLQGVAVGGSDGLGGHNLVVEPVAVIAPQGAAGGVRSNTADGIVAALRAHRQEGAGLQQLGLGDGHLGKALAHVHNLGLGLIVDGLEFAQNEIIDLLGLDVVVVLAVSVGIDQLAGGGFGIGIGIGGGVSTGIGAGIGAGISTGSLVAGAGDHGQSQSQDQQQSKKLFHCISSFFNLFTLRLLPRRVSKYLVYCILYAEESQMSI